MEITDVITIILGRIIEFLINSFKIIHLGKNPLRGGRPLIDNKFRFITNFIFKGICII